jgi:small subunit ribosomal protein S19
MSRSQKKGPYVDKKLLKKVIDQQEAGLNNPIRTWARSCQVVPEFVGHTFEVHNGKEHITVRINENMVGHRLGEFAPTRRFFGHAKEKRAREDWG